MAVARRHGRVHLRRGEYPRGKTTAMKLYLAAPLFSEAEHAFNLALAEALSAAGHDVYLPQRDTPRVDGAARTTAVFRANLAALSNADAVVAGCAGAPG